ncbi:MAG TPA: hypothetical protein EYP40_10750 [Chromatiales bacterium]|nr:hypothetical protein [Chromatiales bacterium]
MCRHEDVVCPRCGRGFECKAGSFHLCQCAGECFDDLRLEFIRLHYEGCLCRHCLEQIQALPDRWLRNGQAGAGS